MIHSPTLFCKYNCLIDFEHFSLHYNPGDLKRPFDKAYSDYERKLGKIEKEKKAIAKEAGE